MDTLVEEVRDEIQSRSEPDAMSMEEALEFYQSISSDLDGMIEAIRDDIARKDSPS